METMPQTRVMLGLEDHELFPDDGQRHELIDGEHIVTPAPTTRHQRIVMRLGMALVAFAESRRLAAVLIAPTDVILSPHDVVQPDILVIAIDRLDIVASRVEGPPNLAVEVLSPSSRRTDEVLKRHAYERWGTGELWVVDPEVDRVRVYRLEAERSFGRARELSAEHDEALDTPLLPGFSMTLGDLFADPLLDARG